MISIQSLVDPVDFSFVDLCQRQLPAFLFRRRCARGERTDHKHVEGGWVLLIRARGEALAGAALTSRHVLGRA
jgi:hypothetical protein